MAVSVDDVKKVLYLDGTDDDALLQAYIDAAKQYVKGAIGDGDAFYQQTDVVPLYEMAVKSLASTYYQYRLSLSDTQTFDIDLTVNSIIGQLRGRYDVWEVAQDETTDQSAKSHD